MLLSNANRWDGYIVQLEADRADALATLDIGGQSLFARMTTQLLERGDFSPGDEITATVDAHSIVLSESPEARGVENVVECTVDTLLEGAVSFCVECTASEAGFKLALQVPVSVVERLGIQEGSSVYCLINAGSVLVARRG